MSSSPKRINTAKTKKENILYDVGYVHVFILWIDLTKKGKI